MAEENKSLPLKYRPRDFDSFFGNKSMITSLKSILDREEGRPHCIMLQGPSGTGKTTLARIIADKLGCSGYDLREYNISDMRGIDTARQIIANCRLAPLQGEVKVYVLNEVHKSTNEFQNAMLEVLEESPTHVYFILCTTEPEKVLKTIRGQRATIFQTSLLPRKTIIQLLKRVADQEVENYSEKLINEIASVCDGSPRKALNILDQIIDIEDDDEAFDAILSATVSETSVKDMIDVLMSTQKDRWRKMSDLIKAFDGEPEQARRAILGYLTAVLMSRGEMRIALMANEFVDNFYDTGISGLRMACYMACQVE